MSYPEVLLWQRLRGSPQGMRFRRQHPVCDGITVDFYCAAARLVVEVDGEIHSAAGSLERDARRDASLRAMGFRILRVLAIDVLRNADDAASSIVALAAAPLHPSPAASGPPPRAGEDQE
ncbi:endonuclease domain-containing protein [Sphingomonas rubra]|uniref:Very-short-patch-repair endonuclease n=1 Tax=Sphingomonas rubra TaxID=634430 RepID=A0A1I5TXC1_9SPHN|nr:Very-short-patch-repair endonuclease [Sphingomonas rubra]